MYSFSQVERICEYSNIPSEPELETDKSKFDHKYPNIELLTWPEEGKYYSYENLEKYYKIVIIKSLNIIFLYKRFQVE